ncbi:MAG: hypothetical protein J6W30_01910 [Bacteroidales bacterium]|nr:hypothetical protein [Bacteroidales bacterium]
MKKQIIIYGSQYGSTKRYAERLAEMTGIEAVDYKKVKRIDDYERIVYFGALCAGGVMGLKKTVGKMAKRLTGPEQYPWLLRKMVSLLFLKKVNGEFEQFAKDWGCTRPLNDKPYSE